MGQPYNTPMKDMRNVNKILVGKPKGKGPVGRPRRDGKISLECVLEKWSEMVWTGFF
jgi:hypothetical protein